VGDGVRTKFWHDLWCRDTVLNEAFPALFCIVRANDAFVADNLELLGGSTQWNVSFAREAHDLGSRCLCFLLLGVALSHCE
jgi:hypothetical protein